MATTTYGSPYVQSSDLVSGWPTASQNVADRIDDVAMKGNGINAQTGTTYTLVLTDAGKNITRSNGSASTLDIPTNASVAFETGTVVAVTNIGTGDVTIQGSGVTINGPSLVLAQYEAAKLMKTATDTWVVVKGGGVPKASVSSTTGSPATGANGSKTYYRWTGSGSVTIGTAGICEILVIGGGGGGSHGGGGAGGYLTTATAYLPAGTHTVTVGAGGAGAAGGSDAGSGFTSRLESYFAEGGGGHVSGGANRAGTKGASGSGGRGSGVGGTGVTGLGNTGGTGGTDPTSGGGGGSSAVGSNGSGGTGGAGGAGTSSSIDGTPTTRAGGGGGGGTSAGGAAGSGGGGAGAVSTAGGAGTANTGGGGGGVNTGPGGGNGGSGIVILLIG